VSHRLLTKIMILSELEYPTSFKFLSSILCSNFFKIFFDFLIENENFNKFKRVLKGLWPKTRKDEKNNDWKRLYQNGCFTLKFCSNNFRNFSTTYTYMLRSVFVCDNGTDLENFLTIKIALKFWNLSIFAGKVSWYSCSLVLC